jgi:YHS domain-containing protein
MGIVQSFYNTLMGYIPLSVGEPIKKCHICEKEIDTHVAREFDGKTSFYFCNWNCYKVFMADRSEERKKREKRERQEVTVIDTSIEDTTASREFSQIEETDYKGQTENPLRMFPPND